MKIEKKEVKTKNKRKWVVGGIVLFSSLALVSTGFATWVIGNSIESKDQNITVEVDDATNNDIQLAVTFSETALNLQEPTSATDATGPVKVVEGGDTDLTVTLDSIVITHGAGLAKTISNVTISLPVYSEADGDNAYNQTNSYSGNAAINELRGNTGTTYSFVSFETVTFTIGTDLVVDDSYTTATKYILSTDEATVAKKTLTFDWGTLFNGKKPTEYYNGLLADTEDQTTANFAGVEAELTAMKDLKTITLKAEINYAE